MENAPVVKPEWGTKRSCPKCGTRFYDLGAEDPVTCIACGNAWMPEPILKSKQPLPFESQKAEEGQKGDDSDLDAEDLDLDEEEDGEKEDVDIGGDDDLGLTTSADEDES